MGKITVTRAYHIGMPVNDIKRAEKFYVDVLGMKVKGRGAGERESNRLFFEELGYWPENLRLATAKGDMEVVLFERPKPIERDWKEDSFCHTAEQRGFRSGSGEDEGMGRKGSSRPHRLSRRANALLFRFRGEFSAAR